MNAAGIVTQTTCWQCL